MLGEVVQIEQTLGFVNSDQTSVDGVWIGCVQDIEIFGAILRIPSVSLIFADDTPCVKSFCDVFPDRVTIVALYLN